MVVVVNQAQNADFLTTRNLMVRQQTIDPPPGRRFLTLPPHHPHPPLLPLIRGHHFDFDRALCFVGGMGHGRFDVVESW